MYPYYRKVLKELEEKQRNDIYLSNYYDIIFNIENKHKEVISDSKEVNFSTYLDINIYYQVLYGSV